MTRTTRRCELEIDGASLGNPGPAGVGVVLIDGADGPPKPFAKALGPTTNNVAEYLALVYALQAALRQGYRGVTVRTDSELLARQLAGRYKVRDPQLRLFYDVARDLIGAFADVEVRHVPREQNRRADRLAGQAALGRETPWA